ncbi:MAG TPA: ABC transporter ATP-binding protein [Candidatus Scybalocola faecavium]|nr:ABC transporter ATP-binding protein [Candidatus Scybalocola faecavium]
MDEKNIIMDVQDLKKYYPMSKGSFSKGSKKTLKALDGVSLQIRKGEIFGIVGESGCGKSTLGRAMLRLFDVTDGKILFEGNDITHLSRRQLKGYRKNMQMIFQNPYSSFNPKQRIGSALREVGKVYGMSSPAVEEKIHELLEYIHLPQDMLLRSPGELSGGQLQRLAIARALILNPSFIVADEPVSALDVSVQAQILNLITDLRKKVGMTMLFISHEMTVVEHICDQVAVMYLGKVMEVAPTKVLFKNILHPYTQALMSAIPKADPEADNHRIMLEGDIPNAIDLPAGCRFASRCRFCTEECKNKMPELTHVGDGHYVACHKYNSGIPQGDPLMP